MHRQFQLRQISFNEFNSYCEENGLPKETPGKRVFERRYFQILNPLIYPTLSDLLNSIEDKFQRPRTVWAKGLYPISISREKTMNDRASYFAELVQRQSSLSQIQVEICREPHRSLHDIFRTRKVDIFRFLRRQQYWQIGFFYIKKENFKGYRFFDEKRNLFSQKFIDSADGFFGIAQNH